MKTSLSTSVCVSCPLKECTKVISVRDIQQLMPKGVDNNFSSKAATERLVSELKHIKESNPEKNVFFNFFLIFF